MTYSPELIKFATASAGHNLISRTGALTKLGEQFSQLLEGYSLTFPEAVEDVGSDYMVVLVDKGKISVLEEF